MRSILAKSPLIAILRHIPPEKAEPYAASLLRAGVRAVEVALNSAGALEEIALLKSRFGDALAVGAGTAVTVKKAQDAVAAGADFLLSPSSDGDVLRWCAGKGRAAAARRAHAERREPLPAVGGSPCSSFSRRGISRCTTSAASRARSTRPIMWPWAA